MKILPSVAAGALALFTLILPAAAADPVIRDARLREPATLNTLRTFPEVGSRAAWNARREEIRQQILVSAGLWPMPEKAPLDAQVFDRTEHGDFSVEKVYIRTLNGFYLGGNLYRPLGKGKGPFPAVLNPHGHWNQGRLEDGLVGSIPARCIAFARQGMVAFAYDMVGYNDTQFGDVNKEPGYNYHRRFGVQPADLLWNINLMGLQTWNSIRALDFICSLPEVDQKRLACTGASGGGTQTFMLAAIDDRLDVMAPTVMVSHSMQGGCSCENMPGLRLDFSNMEIAAVPVPKPQVFIAATGDWTRAFMTIEGPAIASVYRLFGAEEQVRYKVLNFNHNYNKSTREEVYVFLGEHLLKRPAPASLKERPYPPATNLNLLVFGQRVRPADTLTISALSEQLKAQARTQWNAMRPIGPASHRKYADEMKPAWRHTVQVAMPDRVQVQTVKEGAVAGLKRTALVLGREGRGDRVPAILFTPEAKNPGAAVILVHRAGKSAYLDAQGLPKGLAKRLLEAQCRVLLPDPYMTGDLFDEGIAKQREKQVDLFFATYNRTDAQERAQDLITACGYLRQTGKQRVVLCGEGTAGLWALLAAPASDAVVADTAQLNLADDAVLLSPDIFVPGLRRLGGFEGVALLNAPKPLLVHNTGGYFDAGPLETAYTGSRQGQVFQHQAQAMSESGLLEWILTSARNP